MYNNTWHTVDMSYVQLVVCYMRHPPDLGLVIDSYKVKIQRVISRAAVLGVRKAYINNAFAFSEQRYLGFLGFAL